MEESRTLPAAGHRRIIHAGAADRGALQDEAAPPADEMIRLSDGTEINPNVPPCATEPEPRPRASRPLMVLMAIAIGVVLYATRDVVVPVVFALMLALLLRPLLRRMRRWNIPPMASALVLVGAVVVLFAIAIGGLAGQAQRWLATAPQTLRSVKNMLASGEGGTFSSIKETSDAVEELTNDEESSLVPKVKLTEPKSQDWAMTVLGVSGHFIAAAMVVFVLAFFLLALSDQLLKQMVEALPSFCEKRNAVQLVQNVETGMSRYLATITVINIGLGVATALVTWLLGLENFVLWGVMATTLNYVPHVGAFLAMVILFFVGALEHESLLSGAVAAGAFALLTTIESYFITPLMLSRSLELSPLAVILSILLFGWMWGIGGGLLAAPLLAVIKIVLDQFESLQPYGQLLGATRTSPALANSTQESPAALKEQVA